MSLPTYEELLKRNRNLLEEQKNKALGDSDKIYDTQITDVTGTYNKAIDKAKNEFESEYEKNAVNKLINEKRIAEKNSRLGLTDSGLNRTQQTAVELSYANQRGKIDLARKNTTDSLAEKLAEAVSTIQINKASARGNIEQSYEKLAADNASSEYNSNMEAETARQKAAMEAETARQKAAMEAETAIQKAIIAAQAQLQKAAYSSSRSSSKKTSGGGTTKTGLISVNGGLVSRPDSGTLAENGVSVIDNGGNKITYVDNNTGKKTTLSAGTNPFTGTINSDVKTGGKFDAKKAFSNGYQPNNIGGRKLVQSTRNNKDGDWYDFNGQTQRIWTIAGTNQYFLWDGSTNRYVTFSY